MQKDVAQKTTNLLPKMLINFKFYGLYRKVQSVLLLCWNKIYKIFELSGVVRVDYMMFDNEIYVNEGDYQITYHLLLEQGGKTIVGVSVYGKRKRGKTRNKLRFLHLELKEIFKKYI